ncbi:MAG TPA: nitroreductase family protein, partial [Candidatus Limnocylindria bacterium]
MASAPQESGGTDVGVALDAPPIEPQGTGQKWTPERIWRGIRRRLQNRSADLRDAVMLPLASSSSRLASIGYATVNGAFRREHRAVAAGRRRYRAETAAASRHYFVLRRNVHRIEKGLVMRPRRAVFAAGYVLDTVRAYRRLVELAQRSVDLIDPAELRWARDVLHTYFGVVGRERAIDRARAEFEAIPVPDLVDIETLYAPYPRDLSRPPSVPFDDLLALSVRRRSVRWYLPKTVPRELVDRALEIAAQAPSACNRQPFEFRIVDDPDLLHRVARIPMGTGGFAGNLPGLAVVVGKLRAFAKERDRHLIYIDGALAAMAFIYGLEALGLASCCINWADVDSQERAMAGALDLDP